MGGFTGPNYQTVAALSARSRCYLIERSPRYLPGVTQLGADTCGKNENKCSEVFGTVRKCSEVFGPGPICRLTALVPRHTVRAIGLRFLARMEIIT